MEAVVQQIHQCEIFAGLRAEMSIQDQQPCPVTHRFTKGMYIREIFMPAGTMIVSKIHKTQHPFVVLSGKVEVCANGEDNVIYEAGYVGITEPGTERLLFIWEDTRWVTFHPNPFDEKDLDKLENFIIQKPALKQ